MPPFAGLTMPGSFERCRYRPFGTSWYYLYLREHARAFDELAAHNSTAPPMIVAAPGGPVGVSGAVVTANYFTLLRLTP